MYSAWRREYGDPHNKEGNVKRIRIGIHGFTRQSKMLIRLALQDPRGVDVVMLNCPHFDAKYLIYQLKYDSNLGRLDGEISDEPLFHKKLSAGDVAYNYLEICGRKMAIFHETNSGNIPWQAMNIDYVLIFNNKCIFRNNSHPHIRTGRCAKVIGVGRTIDLHVLAFPFKLHTYAAGLSRLSFGTPLMHALNGFTSFLDYLYGIEEGYITILRPVDVDTPTVDGATETNRRLGRGGHQNMVPLILKEELNLLLQVSPKLRNRLMLMAINLPVVAGAMALIFTGFLKSRPSSLEAVEEDMQNCEPLQQCQQTYQRHYDLSVLSSNPKDDPEDKVKRPPPLCNFIRHLPVSGDIAKSSSLVNLDVPASILYDGMDMVKIVCWYNQDFAFTRHLIDSLSYLRNVDSI